MNVFSKSAAWLSVFTLFLVAATPVEAVMYNNPIEASRARCNEVAGREKSRCEFFNNRIGRFRLRQSTSTTTRGHTSREQRILRKDQHTTVFRFGTANMARLRQHDRNGGNARRMITEKDAAARAKCEDLEGTVKYQCIRTNTFNSAKGNTR